jgi:hypothetical protein
MNKFLVVAGLLIVLDAIGSILLPSNRHGFWFDLERVLRGWLGVGVMVYGFRAR